MVKFQIELHDQHFALLQQMAECDYRDPKQQAAWLISCVVSASAGAALGEAAPAPGEARSDGSDEERGWDAIRNTP